MKYTDDELKGVIDRALKGSVGAPDSEIAQQRQRNLEYYIAEPVGELAPPEIEERSDIVSTDVPDTVEWMLPGLLRPFVSTREAIQARAKKPQAEPMADFVSDVVRHYFWDKLGGFEILYSLAKDGLIQKVGFCEVGWETYTDESEETYRGMTEVQLAITLQDQAVEVVEQEQQVIQDPMLGAVTTYTVKVRKREEKGRHVIQSIPPEEMRVGQTAVYDKEPDFIAREFRLPKNRLEAMGYDTSDLSTDEADSEEALARRDTYSRFSDDDAAEETGLVKCVKAYIKLDDDDDGIPEWVHVFLAGDKLMEREKVDDHPFVYFCPAPMPHAFYGNCPAGFAVQPQKFRTRLMRAVEDNVYLTVNRRVGVIGASQETIDDLLNNRPGGIVRLDRENQLSPMEVGGLGADVWQAVEWGEQWVEKRTGFSRMSKGLSSDALNDTATGVLEITERADMRVEMIARHLSNSLRCLLLKLIKCLAQYQDKPTMERVSGKWVDVDPRGWDNQFDILVDVGLGSASRDRQLGMYQAVSAQQAQMVGAGLVPPQAAIALARKIAGAAGLEDPEQYFPDPPPPQPPQPDPALMLEQAKMQAQAQAEQMKAQVQMQLERERMQMQAEVDVARQRAEAEQQQLKAEAQMQLEKYKAELQVQLERLKLEMQQQTQLAVARINAESKLDAAQIQGQTVLSQQQESASDDAVNQ